MTKEKIKLAAVAAAVLAAVIIFSAMIVSYIGRFSDALVEENSNYLSDIAEHMKTNMHIVVDSTKKAMETAGLSVSAISDDGVRMSYLEQMRDKYSFDYAGYAAADGELFATMSSRRGNIAGEDYFKRSLSGESIVTYVPRMIYTNNVVSGLMFSVPVYEFGDAGGRPTGVMVAFLEMSNFGKSIDIMSFSGQGDAYIIDKDGDTILHTKRMDYSNLFVALKNTQFAKGYSVDKVVSDISGRKPGFSIYTNFGVEKYMYYKYVGIDSWSVVSVVAKDTITEKTTRLARQLTWIGIAVIILFPLLLVIAVLSLGSSNESRRAAQAKAAFLANMSHEIRTPMNAIVGIGEILMRENITGKQKNYVLGIVNAGNGLLTIINDILDISKMESGKFNIIDEEYELESLIYDVTTIVSIRIGEKPIEFFVDIDPELPKYVVGDMVRVKQVLLNIIGNAAKFTREGHIKFGIYATASDGEIELSMPIEDTGIGIREKDMRELFESFNQVDTHRNHTIEGTGLGLVISKRLSEMMGGGISVYSEYGRGSTFTVNIKQKVSRPERMLHISKQENFNVLLFEEKDILLDFFETCMLRMGLPHEIVADYETFSERAESGGYTHIAARAPALDRLVEEGKNKEGVRLILLLSENEQSMAEDYEYSVLVPLFTMQMAAVLYNRPDHQSLTRRGGMDILAIYPLPFARVLIVDDSEVNLQVANGLMSPYHMKVDCVLSGAKAIEAIKNKNYDLVFMDHMMPEMDGVEAARIIRKLPDESQSRIVIVALTANVTHDAKSLFIDAGFDDFLSKPIETVKLNAVLKKWLKDKNDERAEKNPEEAKKLMQNIETECGRALPQEPGAKAANEPPENAAEYSFISPVEAAERLGGREVYRKILETYCRSAREKLSRLPDLMENDRDMFTIEIHGLKGASGGVLAQPVAKSAARLEALSKEKNFDVIRAEMPEFLEELNKTLDEAERFIASCKVGEPRPEPDATQRQSREKIPAEVLAAMKSAFMDFDSERLGALFAEQEVFRYEEPEAGLLAELSECYKTYDFDSPVQLLEDYEAKNFESGGDGQ